MRIGLRGHDVSADNPEELCRKIVALGVNEIQLVVHKSFPDFQYNAENIQVLANVFVQNHIQVAVYGCYIDPLTPSGQERFLEHIRYAKKLNADVIATESAIGKTAATDDPLIGFAKNNKKTVLITEGLTGENLFKFMNQIQKENRFQSSQNMYSVSVDN